MKPETREAKAKATNAKKDIATDAFAISMNLCAPCSIQQLLKRQAPVAADDEADIRIYAKAYR